MAEFLIVRIIILKNKKWIWITYSNSSTILVGSFLKFISMQKLFHSNIQIFKIVLDFKKSKTCTARATFGPPAQILGLYSRPKPPAGTKGWQRVGRPETAPPPP
jgi:hypothetical protein